MDRIKQLLASLAAVDAKIDKLLDHDSLTADQAAEHDRLQAERAGIVQQVDREKGRLAREEERTRLEAEAERTAAAERLAERRASRTASVGRITSPDTARVATPTGEHRDGQGRVIGTWEETDEIITATTSPNARREPWMRNLRSQNRHNWRQLRQAGYVPWGGFRNFNDFVRQGLESHSHSSFREAHHRHLGPMLTSPLGMGEGVGSDGGYTVMPEFSTNIIDRVWTDEDSLWSYTDNYNVSGNNLTFLANAETSRADGSRAGGLRGYWLGEGGTFTASKPTLREISLKLLKLGVVVYLTDELVNDTGVALEQYVARKVSEEFMFLMGNGLVNGTGAGQPLGILNAPGLVAVSKVSGQASATLVSQNIVSMFSRVFGPSMNRILWLHHQDVITQLFLLTLGIGTAGIATYMPPGGLSGSPYATIMGRPTKVTEFNGTLGSQGDIIAADMGQMLSIAKGGVMQAVSMHVQFLTDQLALRFIMRLNAQPWENAPITPYKGSNTQASFVTLAAR